VIETRGRHGSFRRSIQGKKHSKVDLGSQATSVLAEAIAALRETGLTDSEIRNAFTSVMKVQHDSQLDSVLIAVTFATQIFLLAYYLPRRRRTYQELISHSLPPAEYRACIRSHQDRMARTLVVLQGIQRLIGVAAVLFSALASSAPDDTFE
jgi:hypothetical protein